MFLLFNQKINTVKRNSPVVANYPTSAICIRQSRQKPGASRFSHFRRVDVENSVIVGFSDTLQDRKRFFIKSISIVHKRLVRHPQASIKIYHALKRRVGLKPYNDFILSVYITGFEIVYSRKMLSVDI